MFNFIPENICLCVCISYLKKQGRSNNIERDMSALDELHLIELVAKISITILSFFFLHQEICSYTKPVEIDAIINSCMEVAFSLTSDIYVLFFFFWHW
jgi:hypothetical protein